MVSWATQSRSASSSMGVMENDVEWVRRRRWTTLDMQGLGGLMGSFYGRKEDFVLW